MTTDMPRSPADGPPTGRDRRVRRSGPSLHGRSPRWTDAHTEAARFVGECIGAGALLGMVAAMSRARTGD